jgi:Ca2+-binding EF-hand superfamily protein
MFEQLMDLVKQNSQEAIVNNPAVPNEQNDAVMETAGSSIMSTLQGMLSGGGASSVLNLFNQGNQADVSNHPVTQAASSNLVSTLMSKFGISGDKAGGIASMLLPVIMSKLVNKTNDSNDNSFNIQGIFNSLSGGKTGGMDIGSLVSQFGGNALDKNHDGKVDLSDLTAAFSGGGDNNTQQANTTQSGGGGIMDTISGLFGK